MNTVLPLETPQLGHAKVSVSYLWKVFFHPVQASREIAMEKSIPSSLAIVAGYGTTLGLLFGISALAKDYPPPAAELQIWIKAWGEFAMLPFLKIPAENYRLFLAFAMLPIALAAWMLMAGSAKILSILFGGKATYEQWLNLTCFAFFPLLILSSLLDVLYSGLLGDFTVPALQMKYGPAIQIFFHYFPQVFYTILLALAGVYTAIAARQAEGFSWWKSAMIGAVAFAWTTIIWATLLR